MTDAPRSRGRPKKFAEYDRFLASLPKPMTKRPAYLNGIGVFRGERGDTAWIKVRLSRGGTYNGRLVKPGEAVEIKVGQLSSWPWDRLAKEHDRYQERADRGEALEDEVPVSFAEWADGWLERSKTRLRSYPIVRAHVNLHLKPTFGRMPLNGINVAKINSWVAERLKTQKPATVKRELDTLKAILNDAARSGLIAEDPCRHADPVRGIVGRQRFLSGEELVALLASAEAVAPWLPDYILWSIHSGMRKGEVRGLLWSDIRTLPNGTTLAQVRTSKSDQPRTVTCTETMKAILKRQGKRKVKGDDRVFPVVAMTLRRKWEKARVNAKLGDVTIHDLRRTHSTYAAVAGVDLRTLAARIGHSDLTMLQRHYAALVGSAEAEATARIGMALDTLASTPLR